MGEGRSVAISSMPEIAERIFACEPLPVPLDIFVVFKTTQQVVVISDSELDYPGLVELLSQKRVS